MLPTEKDRVLLVRNVEFPPKKQKNFKRENDVTDIRNFENFENSILTTIDWWIDTKYLGNLINYIL